jgi:hypothetical protein
MDLNFDHQHFNFFVTYKLEQLVGNACQGERLVYWTHLSLMKKNVPLHWSIIIDRRVH